MSSFEFDLAVLRATPLSAPVREMRLRHQRRMDSSASVAHVLSGARSKQYQVVALYDRGATNGSRPIVVVEVDATADFSLVAQGSVVVVRGWPEVGRAVVLDIDGTLVEPTYPCTAPVFRAMRLR